MKFIEQLRTVSAATGHWTELVQLQNDYDSYTDPRTRENARYAISDGLHAIADDMERSSITRLWFSSFKPEDLRARARDWENGVAR